MQQENTSEDIFSNSGIELDEMAKQYIRSMASWAMIMVVIAVIGYAFNIIELFRVKQVTSNRIEGFDGAFTETASAGSSTAIVSTLVSIVVGLVINYFLFRFARQSRLAVDAHDQQKLNSGIANLKNYFMACSVVLIIVFVYFLFMGLVFGTAGKAI